MAILGGPDDGRRQCINCHKDFLADRDREPRGTGSFAGDVFGEHGFCAECEPLFEGLRKTNPDLSDFQLMTLRSQPAVPPVPDRRKKDVNYLAKSPTLDPRKVEIKPEDYDL